VGCRPVACPVMTVAETAQALERNAERVRQVARSLAGKGVRAVAVTIVDNAGVTRVKTFPTGRLERAARWGVGLTPAFAVFMVNDAITSSDSVAGPTGDLRLILDPDGLQMLPGQPGWAWAPADQFTQEGEPFACCQRSFLRRMVARATDSGLSVLAGCELEWFLGQEKDGAVVPAGAGPGYGAAVLAQLSDYARDLVAALEDQGAGVEQFHPEYAPGQLELSLSHRPPLVAADLNVLVRQAIRSISARDGWQASFSPVVVPGQVGNGGHVHLSLWREGRNLLAGGNGPHGMTAEGEAFVAGILAELPALLALGAPSVVSYLRLVPSHWAGAYACWGRENREAAVRFITGMVGDRDAAANVEVKCFDQSANPYLAVGALIAAGLSGVERSLTLPPEVEGDPASYPEEELAAHGIQRLPRSLGESLKHLEESEVLRQALGTPLHQAFVAVRRAELDAFGSLEPEAVTAVHRFRY
jgi:glutamine synthetase